MSEINRLSGMRIIVRVVLFILLAAAIGALVIDRKARSQAQAAYDAVTDFSNSSNQEELTPENIQGAIGHPPDDLNKQYGGWLEEYHFASPVPGRIYQVLVAYAEVRDGEKRYVDHYLNEIDNTERLEDTLTTRHQFARDPDAQGFVDRVMAYDENLDGVLTLDELPEERAERMLEWGDANGDDALDESEVEDMAASFAGQRGGRGSRGRGGAERGGDGDENDDDESEDADDDDDGDEPEDNAVQRPQRPQRPEAESP